MDIKIALKNYGLEDEESRLYLAALETGEAPLARIAKRAGLKRSSAYVIAKNLEEKGLLGNFKIRSGLRFVASQPSALLEQLNRKTKEISEVLPELKAIYKESDYKPKVTVYEGEEGYFTILNDSLETKDGVIRSIGSLKKLYEVISRNYDDKHYVPARVKNKIKYKGLHFKAEAGNIFTPERNTKELREIKFLPENYSHPTFTLIYENSVAIFTSQKELVALKIESKEIAQSEKDKFDLIWSLV
jgi:HTH-type transcriptional regulator, sugar sensing transcriptional regulator